jgi:hypothetical protein
MKKQKVWQLKALGLTVMLLALVLTACGDGSGGGGGSGGGQQISATAATFDDVFKSVNEKPGNYVITLTGDLLGCPQAGMKTAGVNITVKGTGSNKITLGTNALFWVSAGKLTLENINIGYGSTSDTRDPPVVIDGGTVEIKNGVTLSSNNGTQFSDGVYISRGTFIMSGGVIENCGTGLATNGSGASITISGGTIRNNNENGIGLWDDSSNCTINMSGGTISGNGANGVYLGCTGTTFTMSGGTIEKNNDCGVRINGNGNTFKMSGGRIEKNNASGMVIHGNGNNTFTMSGGSIGGNEHQGLYVKGANNGFEKQKGAVIYGNTGGNKNGFEAISIDCGNQNNLRLAGDAASDKVYAAKINANGNDIASKTGEWN